jgi:hypothetical protein
MSDEKGDDILSEAKEAFELAQEVESQNREAYKDDVRFARLGEQWDELVRQQREMDQRPCLTVNKLPAFIRQVVNDARQNKPSIKVHPADSKADVKVADIYSGLIRNIEYTSDADVAYDTALECAVTGGFGYFKINTRYATDDTFEQDIVIERIANPLAVYGDPFSTAADSSDWNCALVVDFISKDAYEKEYKGEPVNWSDEPYVGLADPWLTAEGVLIAEYWCREKVKKTILLLSSGEVVNQTEYEANLEDFQLAGIEPVGEPRETESYKVKQYILSGAEVLKTVEWPGKFIPIVPVYGEEVNFEGKRIWRSLIRDAKDSQRMYNYWRTMATELVALAPKAPFIGPRGAFETDAAKWETANVMSHAYMEYDGGTPPQRQVFAGVPAGALQEALSTSDEMKAVMGMYDASLGQRSNETSGRAIMARQREGDTNTFHFIDNLTRAIRHAGRILIDLIPHVYSTERVVRVLGPDAEPQSVPVNTQQPVPVVGPDGQPQLDDQGNPILAIYELALGKYDLIVNAGPSFTSRREEAATQMTELIRAFPPAAGVLGDLVAKNMDWPEHEEVAKRLASLNPANQQQGGGIPPEVQQQIQQGMAQIQQLTAENQTLKTDNSVKVMEMQIKANEAQTNRFEAETERMKVLHEMRQPPEAAIPGQALGTQN